jgi:hypothetical protein
MKASRRSRARDARKSASGGATKRAQERGTELAGSIAPEATGAATVDTPEPYHTGWEHLSDELRRLDLLISCRLPEQGAAAATTIPLQEFKGLVLTEEEIRRLLVDPFDTSSSEMNQEADDLPTRRLQAALDHVSSHIQARRTASLRDGVRLPLHYLTQLFNLTAFEEQCLLICLAPE